ncbi:protein OXIDATIVE STRESS 3 LIKE 4-like [Phragmites australis]|uniref:protein OXIDATIVE STRESS 3 LIKE 4-like n=1 Tax=Phragmites australis TaxID=29695 RepID=UPI002D7736D0|nr:protein OXIDATIVE STRESS 3 LIKE 4-like [Phragmites australis]
MSVVAAVGPGAAPAYGGKLCGGRARKRKDVVQDQEAEEGRGDGWQPHGLFVLETVKEDDDEERSSIGVVSDEEDEEGEEVDSGGTAKRRKDSAGALACMDALDDALPTKRGLSNFFSGRSRSFANLQDAVAAVTSARDLAKPENPFNKRRRVLRCCSIRRVNSTSLTALPSFSPPAGNGINEGAGSG